MPAYETSLLEAVVVVPVSVVVHLHAVLFGHVPGVEGKVWLIGSPVGEAQRRLISPGPADCKIKRGQYTDTHHIYRTELWLKENIGFILPLSTSKLTVVVPGEADPDVVIFGVVEVPDELDLCSAVDGGQVPPDRLAVVSRVRPGETLLTVVHVVTVAAVGEPEGRTLPITGSWSRWRFLWETTQVT